MTAPQTSSPAAASTESNGADGAFPAEVLAFAAASGVKDCLQPLLEATQRIFPTARFIKVEIDDDPEIRDDRHILHNVQVAGLPLEQARTTRTQWIHELFRICSTVRSCVFRLRLDLKR
jgi:hypothetical protein